MTRFTRLTHFAGISMLPWTVASLVSGCAEKDADYERIVMTDEIVAKNPSQPAGTAEEDETKKRNRRDELISKANTPAKVETKTSPSVFAAEHNARLNRKLRGVTDDAERQRIIRDNGGYEY